MPPARSRSALTRRATFTDSWANSRWVNASLTSCRRSADALRRFASPRVTATEAERMLAIEDASNRLIDAVACAVQRLTGVNLPSFSELERFTCGMKALKDW